MHEIRHFGRVDADHAQEEVGLNGPREGGEAGSKEVVDDGVVREPPALRVGQEGGGDDGEFDGVPAGRRDELLDRDVGSPEAGEGLLIELDGALAGVAVGGHGWVKGDGVGFGAAPAA